MKLSAEQRSQMLELYRAGKSGGWLARKFGVSESYPRFLSWAERNPDKAKARPRPSGWKAWHDRRRAA